MTPYLLLGGGMLGKLYVVPDELLLYRVGGGETTSYKNYRKGMAKGIRYCDDSQLQLLKDVEVAKSWLSADEYEQFRTSIERFHGHLSKILMLYEGKNFRERLIGYREGCKDISIRGIFSQYGLIVHLLLLSPKYADFCFMILMHIKKYFRNFHHD